MGGLIDMKPITRSSLFNIVVMALSIIGLILMVWVVTASFSYNYGTPVSNFSPGDGRLHKFNSDAEMVEAFKNLSYYSRYSNHSLFGEGAVSGRLTTFSATAGLPNSYSAIVNPYADTLVADYSTTNVQVIGVDEADIIKTDGDYIYLVTVNKLFIIKASPANSAQVVSLVTYDNFTPGELFVSGDRLLVLGTTLSDLGGKVSWSAHTFITPQGYRYGVTSAKLYDISSKGNPRLIKTVEIEGYYDTARLIGDYAYFTVNTNRNGYASENSTAENYIPFCREDSGEFQIIANATDIYYLSPILSTSFVTICAVNISSGDNVKETIVSSGNQIYASHENLYFTRTEYGYGGENTTIVKLHLDRGDVKVAGSGKVPGRLLNQFSMDEQDGYFRVATTRGSAAYAENNIYVLDGDMNLVSSLEGLAPGESIYSARFLGSRCYLVTFQTTDPLFVIDLSDPLSPRVLGELKIPGYSNYLHPYDETHLIGIGMDTVDSGDDKSGILNSASIQGVKMAMFDVSDVEHPLEMYKVVIGDRGSGSAVLNDHRAFLFDKGRSFIVLPVSVETAKVPKSDTGQYSDYLWEGAYVYDVNLTHGFLLRGNVTHFDTPEEIQNCSYLTANGDRSVRRSLYIGDVLYTMSRTRLQLNDLNTLEKLKAIEIHTVSKAATYDPNVSPQNGFYQFPLVNSTIKP